MNQNPVLNFTTIVRASGNTGHVTLPASLVGKEVDVTIRILEDYNTLPALDLGKSSRLIKLEFMPSNI